MRSLEVVGTVSPHDAVVSVSGQRASVASGEFSLPLTLAGPVTRIEIVATAHGYRTSTVPITVRYVAPPRAAQSANQPSPAPSAGPSPEVLARANGICSDRNKRVSALPILTPANLSAHDAAMATINASVVARLRAVEHTAADRSTLAPFVSYLAAAVADNARMAAASKAGNGRLAAHLTQLELNRALQLNSEASSLGIPACGLSALWSVGSGRA